MNFEAVFLEFKVLPLKRRELGLKKLILCKLAFYQLRYRTRRQLALLSDAQLKDVGLTRNQALNESQKSFWQS